ncbi:hypothetical protein K469DRAFT_692521 [Zopfia rhizophila CBS 207.26]|uniref:Uncharacterized protein n=1 Tax=Zopfia rhizophila CBS 207.26 TaxID=1314779 RepID=A0A6A6DPS1_9PEZI|nr:hypothetical protein K469DRAFT_692521 [Zopfia rhizophila CBS 207.26]
MAPIRQSNIDRRRVRDECRDKLSKHIQSRLGIQIKPSEVRLIPNAADPYAWKVLSEKAELFSKNISDHSIGAYRELCEGVGVTFEAVSSITHSADAPDSLVSLRYAGTSFSAKIDQLKEENARLLQELHEWRDKATAESERRELAEGQVRQLHGTHQQLQEQVRGYAVTADNLRSSVSMCFQGLDKVLPVLEELRTGVSMGVNEV